MIHRTISDHIKYIANFFPIVSLTGPRQSGKTTLLKELFPNYAYVSLEDPDMREFAESDPRRFLQTYNQYVIIDEAQRVPQLFSYLQSKVDTDKIMGQYILSGSQNFLLLSSITQSLAGRVAICKLFPLTIEELQQSGLHISLNDFMFQGGYPVIYDRGISPTDYYPNYIETYIERDVRDLVNVRDLRAFRLFVRLCAGRAGQILNLSALAVECGITHPTAKAWLSILESSYIIFTLEPYFKNFNKRITKSPKLYFTDTGLLCYLLGIQEGNQLDTHYLRGHIFENMILSSLMKTKAHQNKRHELWFWRDANQNEVDVVVEQGDQLRAVEIKSGMTIGNGYFKSLVFWQSLTGQGANDLFMVYAGENREIRTHGTVLGWRNASDILS